MRASGSTQSGNIRLLCGKLGSLSEHQDEASNLGPAVTAALSAFASIAGLLDQWLMFGLLSIAVLVASAFVGFGPAARLSRIKLTLVGFVVVMMGLVFAMAYLHPMADANSLWLGLPPATAVLVYLLWPLQSIIGILYVGEFSRTVLPDERLDQFMAEYGRQGK